MAEIDKGLPNTRTKLEIPSEEEIAEEISVEEPEEQKGPGPIISSIISNNYNRIKIPVMIVPGNLTKEHINQIG